MVIPVFLGNAAAIPEQVSVQGVTCLSLELKTLKEPIKTEIPISAIHDVPKFILAMVQYERLVKAKQTTAARFILLGVIPKEDQTFLVCRNIRDLTQQLVDLENRGWNGIWARILSNFFTTACLGRFSVIIGNPPWIDWKNLPEGYRNRIKAMCIERGLFSGAGLTGGINLNICALIAHVAMTNWLDKNGRLAFLMPRELANQASYQGWRRLGGKWDFLEFHDWSKAGNPFDPVKEDFMTFIIGRADMEEVTARSVPVTWFRKKRKVNQKSAEWKTASVAREHLDLSKGVSGRIIPKSTAFTFAQSQKQLDEFALVAGNCQYIGREGTQFYPKELQLFRYLDHGPRHGTIWLSNVQAQRTQHKLPYQTVLLETRYLHPLVTAPSIKPYQYEYDGLLVAFPYDSLDPKNPIPPSTLYEVSPLLLAYYNKNREIIENLSPFNARIRGSNADIFYGLARTGPYSFADVHVAFRKDTKWCATVVSSQSLPWGEKKRLMFQSHAVSMCERQSGGFISEEEAHYICAILNVPLVDRFIKATSDNRSFKVRPPIYVPLYDPEDNDHARLADMSQEAHSHPDKRAGLQRDTETIYLRMCKRRNSGGKG